MVPTDPADGASDFVNKNLDTLRPEEESYGVEDQLLRRKLKHQMFGAAAPAEVKIGRYHVLERIGHGAMGTVYAAVDGELDRKIAIKLLRAGRPDGRERMLREARALAKLSHPNVVTVHEVGTHGERVFVAMEFIAGQTLRAWLSGSRSRVEIFDVLRQAACGLHAAHQAGLVHRDFKPDNVIIGRDGRVRVVDFGLAKPSHAKASETEAPPASPRPALQDEAAIDLTRTGQLVGTPAYMAAEQFLGESVDTRTDVFAFSVTLYECLAQTRPFAGESTAELCRAVLGEKVRALEVAELSRALPALVRAGLRKDPEHRPHSMLPFIEALEPAAPAAKRWRRRMLVPAALLAALGGVGVFVAPSPPGSDNGGSLAVGTRMGVQALEATAAASALRELIEAPDQGARVTLARAYIEEFAESGGDARRAIAEVALGDSLWRASCADPTLDLCIEIAAAPILATDHAQAAAKRCRAPRRGLIRQRQRDTAMAADALSHLEVAAELAHATPPTNAVELAAWEAAVGLARVRVADADLEPLLAMQFPPALDFEDNAEALSSAAFRMFIVQLTRDSQRLAKQYARVKGATAELDVLAAARTGLVFEAVSEPFAMAPVPAALASDDKGRVAYCDALAARVIDPLRKQADGAYAWCADHAARGDVQGESARLCADRSVR